MTREALTSSVRFTNIKWSLQNIVFTISLAAVNYLCFKSHICILYSYKMWGQHFIQGPVQSLDFSLMWSKFRQITQSTWFQISWSITWPFALLNWCCANFANNLRAINYLVSDWGLLLSLVPVTPNTTSTSCSVSQIIKVISYLLPPNDVDENALFYSTLSY